MRLIPRLRALLRIFAHTCSLSIHVSRGLCHRAAWRDIALLGSIDWGMGHQVLSIPREALLEMATDELIRFEVVTLHTLLPFVPLRNASWPAKAQALETVDQIREGFPP